MIVVQVQAGKNLNQAGKSLNQAGVILKSGY